MDRRIRQIMDKLAHCRRKRLSCFGSDAHGFRLGPTIPEAAVRDFEDLHGIRLPEDYRLFIRSAGNGGAGPYYGMTPLEKWDEWFEDSAAENPDFLSTDCPMVVDEATLEPWIERLPSEWLERGMGSINLCTMGCSVSARLIVSGESRGRVVYIDATESDPYFVGDAGFLDWYQRWLDELLWGWESSWFGYGLPGKEDKVASALGSHSANIRREALRTLLRIPRPARESIVAAQKCLSDSASAVRSGAIDFLGRRALADARPGIFASLRDENPSVRKAAISALAQSQPSYWEPSARALLQDADADVVICALRRLKETGMIRQADLEPLFQSSHPSVRVEAIRSVEGDRAGGLRFPDELLRDQKESVRQIAARAATSDPNKGAALVSALRSEPSLEVMRAMIRSLGNGGFLEGLEALVGLTRHTDAFIRQEAARSLGQLGDPRAIPALEMLLSDSTRPRWDKEFSLSWSTRTVAEEAKLALSTIRRR